MTRRLVKIIVITVSLITLMALSGYSLFESQKSWIEYGYYYWFVSDSKPEPDPSELRYYPENRRGYYQFNPQTILASLDRGKTDIFTPLSEEDSFYVDTEYDNIAWTQSDFLRIANALSQQVWHESLNLDNWDVLIVSFAGDCSKNFGGFMDFKITYFKTIKTGWTMSYTARHIDLQPWRGVADGGGDGDFSTPSIFGWKNVEWTKVRTTAEQAVRIADENGGKAAGFDTNNTCRIWVGLDKNPNRYYEKDWYVDYYRGATTFDVFVDPFTGRVH